MRMQPGQFKAQRDDQELARLNWGAWLLAVHVPNWWYAVFTKNSYFTNTKPQTIQATK
jgi:hypothetical protein